MNLIVRGGLLRVQQEQLAAIFLLLRENQEALGEVTEGDMEEQLKLYSLWGAACPDKGYCGVEN